MLKTKTKSGTNSIKILLGRNKEWPWQVFSGASPHPRLSSCEEFQTVKYLVKYAGLSLRLNLNCKNDSKDVQAKILQLCGDMQKCIYDAQDSSRFCLQE